MMKYLLLIAVLWTSSTMCCAQQPRIELRENSTVQGAQFTLGEVAAFAGIDAQTASKLSQVVLGTSPLPGLERTLTPEQVRTRLRQHGFRPEAFEIVVPAKIVLRRQAFTLETGQVLQAAAQKLRQMVAIPPDAQIEGDAPIRSLSLAESNPQLVPGEPRALGGNLYMVPILVVCRGSAPVALNVRLRVSLLREVLVARRAVRPNEVLDADAIALQRLSVGIDASELLTEPAEAIGRIARRPIAAGQPLKRSAMDEPAVVRRGQSVKLQVRLDGAVVETDAIALQDGKTGGRIRVQVTDTRKTLLATVLGAETVALDVP